ncbi:proline dehydrogenase [bacterium]|nr:MAG: proline dehydrogenase [bacterium]
MLSRSLILRTSAWPPVERLVRNTRIFRPLVSRFIAGDNLNEAIDASVKVLDRDIKVTLDYLGENTANEAEALEAKATYIRMLDRIANVPQFKAYHPTDGRLPADPLNISIKLTQCGLDQGEAFAEKNYRDVLEVAKSHGNFVRIDMEASAYTERTMAMIERVFPDYPNTGTVLQSYLYRTDEDVERMIALGARVRLVKGAYLEPKEVAHPEKEKVDEAYVRQMRRLLEAGFYPAIATQDEKMIDEAKRFVAEKKIDKGSFEFQMLYGIRRDLQESLVKEGYNVRVYVPFGDAWYPYFTRRLAERPANIVFIAKSFFKG